MIAPRPTATRARLPAPPQGAVSTEFEIPFADVDSLEVVWFGHYPRYVDLGRTALLRARGLDNGALRALGCCLMASESFVRHASPLRYADRVRITAWFLEVENRLRIAFRIVNVATGALAAEGWLALVTVRIGGGLCLETPPEILARLVAPGPGSAGSAGSAPP